MGKILKLFIQFMQIVQRPSMALGLGVIVGLLVGLLVGWVLWPLEVTNVPPSHLHASFQSDYILWIAAQYANTGDLEWARSKLGVEHWEGKLGETLEGLARHCESGNAGTCGGEEATRLRALNEDLGEEIAAPAAGFWQRFPWVGVAGVLILVVAAVGVVWFLFSQRGLRAGPAARRQMARDFMPLEEASWGVEGAPVAQFVTTYSLGDDHYDPSFSIELESGEFMGECGVGISETIGVGAPNKVTAFEVWLFDKNDIRTVTMVLMSEYAFHDEALRAKLAPKGEPVLIEVGRELTLQTKTLRVRARVLEVEHGMGNLPPNSFCEKLTVDLTAWAIPGQGGVEPAPEADVFAVPSIS
jgi:hypothetical protein